MGWLIALGILVLLAVLPVGVYGSYGQDGPLVQIVLGPGRLQVYPALRKKKKTEKPKDNKKKPEKKSAGKAAGGAEPKKEKGGPVSDFLPLLYVVLDLLTDFRRKLRVDILEVNLILAGGDPCDVGVNYGKACAAMGNLWPRLEEFFVIKKRDVKIQCDFESSQTLINARLKLTITIGRIFSLGVRHGLRAVKELLKIRKKRKGGANS